MKIENRKTADVKPYDKNPRDNDGAVEAVAQSIREFGFRQPIVVDGEGVIIVGHTRWKAAQKLGLENVPVHVAKDLTPGQIKAYRIADNKLAEIADWNMDLLPLELKDLQGLDFDIAQLGFGSDELEQILGAGIHGNAGLTDPNDVPLPPDEAVTKPGDLWILGDHRLLCGDSAKPADVDRLLNGAPIHLVNTDPPYNVKVEPRSNNAIAAGLSSFQATNTQPMTHHQSFDVARQGPKEKTTKKLRAKDRPLANDFVSDADFDGMLDAWFGNMSRVLVPGHGFYIWGGYANLGNYPPYLKKHELYFSQGIVWDKQHPVLTRKDFMGAFELCQPPDTRVDTPDGTVPISTLRDSDQVVAFAEHSAAMVGFRRGPEVRVGTRDYAGNLYGVAVNDKTTWATDGHIFSVRLVPHADKIWCVYLMRRGRWWRVGKSRILTTWGLGLKQRLEKEGGEEAWILSTHTSNVEAMCMEQVVSARYGIPTTFWTKNMTSDRTERQIQRMYEHLDPMALLRGAQWALADYHRRMEYPFIQNTGTREKYGRRVSFKTRACNLLPGVMEVPLPQLARPKYLWTPIRHVDVQPYRGPVFSLDVAKYQHYVADGIVTHNCFYGWKEGAAHRWFGPNNATDLWHVKKVNPQSMEHLTQKPVDLAVLALTYSSQPGEHVLDLFGGSGSTLIGAEKTGRKAFLMELDPLYSDVIIDRWQRFTGKRAVLESTGKPFPKEPPAEQEAMR